jgi:integrase
MNSAGTPWSVVWPVPRCCPRRSVMAKKDRTKANGEGTIYKRGKGYCGQYHIVTRDGTKKRRSVYAKTRAEAAEKLAAAIAGRDRGLAFDAGSLTLGEYLDGYVEDARGRLRPKPFNRAEGLVRNHVKPTLGNVKLKDLSPAHLR